MQPLQPRTLRRSALGLSLFSILPHLLCCLLPTVAALISLGTTAGLAGALATNPLYMLVDAYHFQLLLIAIISTALSGVITYFSWRSAQLHAQAHVVNDVLACNCPTHKRQPIKIFALSLALLTLDVAWYLTEENLLGLHNHHHEEEHQH